MEGALSIFPWNPEWETGEPAIDEQHKQLLAQLGRLMVALAEGREALETERAMLLLGDYIDTHFRDEEALMEAKGYPGLTHHQLIHDEMRERVRVLMATYGHDPRSIPASVMDFLLTWLKEHLGGEDRLMAQHLRLGLGGDDGRPAGAAP